MFAGKERIIVKGEDKTSQIISWQRADNKIKITFTNGRTYSYNESNVRFVRSVLSDRDALKCFENLKAIAHEVGLTDPRAGNILANHYEKIDFVHEDGMLAAFLTGKVPSGKKTGSNFAVFPFGFNASQKEAVDKALDNAMSVIEGPPGTGKTQTILNILANAVMNGESVAVVSGNNSATSNVQEKLQKYGIDFISAYLGNSQNKQDFIASQKPLPNLADWLLPAEQEQQMRRQMQTLSDTLSAILAKQNELASLKGELDSLVTECKHFEQYYNENCSSEPFPFKYGLSSEKLLELWLLYENQMENGRKPGFWKRLLMRMKFGVSGKIVSSTPVELLITQTQKKYYEHKRCELSSAVQALEQELSVYNRDDRMAEYANLSMTLFKSNLAQKYTEHKRRSYMLDDLWKSPEEFIRDYPVILSTTYSLRSSLSGKVFYDYVIIDEASQVDLVTGALALSCARKAVVVGDLQQLPNVVDGKTKQKTDAIFDSFSLPEYYRYSNHSLLLSVTEMFPDVPKTLLREHYRCHPKIIGFCNEKFYGGRLIVLTKPRSDRKPLVVYTTAPGNHARDHMNQRQIDVIKNEIMPQQHLDTASGSIGIVTPYRNQTNALQTAFAGTSVKADTVDKFQGQENDIIILSTVDNEISEFADDANRLNVAVSRAIDQLIVVTNGNDGERDTNLGDLVRYIEYNNLEVRGSEIYSVFDYLYKQYSNHRAQFLSKQKRVSEYDSENLMFTLIRGILQDEQFSKYDVAVHVPLKMIIRDVNKLNDEEIRYAMNSWTHVDFLIFDKLGRVPKQVVEVDGVSYHSVGSRQAARDELKNEILQKYGIPILRCRTDGSDEREKLIRALATVSA